MKIVKTIMLLILFSLVVSNVNAGKIICPPHEKITNVKFIKAVPEKYSAWIVYSEPFVVNKEEWNVQFIFTSLDKEIKEPSEAINHAQKLLKTLTLYGAAPSSKGNTKVCNYMTSQFTVYLKAFNPPR